MNSRGPNYDQAFLNEAREKLEKSRLLRERYTVHIRNALLIFMAGFGFLLLANISVGLSEEHAYKESIIRSMFTVMAYCCWGHGVAFWLSYKFLPHVAGVVSWISMWVVIPSVIALQVL